MPSIQKVGIKLSKSAKRRDNKQKTRCANAIGDDDAIYARITKSIGNRYFLGIIYDHQNNRHYPEIKMKVLGKNAPRVEISSIVNVTPAEDFDPDDPNPKMESETWEIVTPITEKEIKTLKKEGKISEVLTAKSDIDTGTVKEVDRRTKLGMSNALDELDVGIEFVREDEPEKETEARKDDKRNKRGGTKPQLIIQRDDDDDLVIDDI